MRRLAAPWLALALLLAAGGEDATRPDPDPVAEVAFTADGGLRIDGRPITTERLDRELSRRAADATKPRLGRTSLVVHITFAPGTDYQRILALQERCQALGIVQVEVQR